MPAVVRGARYRRAIALTGRGIITVPLLAEALIHPAFAPLLRVLSSLAVLRRLDIWVATKPRWLILAILAVPFLGVEPLKVLGLVWVGEGLILRGLGLLAFAYGTSFVLVERIYHAGRDKLRTYAWLATCIDFAVGIRDAALSTLRAMPAWERARAIAGEAAFSAKTTLTWVRSRLRRTGPERPV